MKINRGMHVTAVVLVAVSLFAFKASAQTSTTFSDFTEAGDQGFVFTNTGATSSFTSDPISANFHYDVVNGLAPLTGNGDTATIAATVTISGVVDAPASIDPSASITQQFSHIDLTFTDKANGKNLLTVTDTSSTLAASPSFSGTDESETGGINSSTSGAFAQDITYSSAYLNFSNVTADNFGLTFSSLLDTPSGNGPTISADTYLSSFVASGTGTFASTQTPSAITPEPNPAIAILIAFSILCAFGLFKVRKSSMASY
jgi:hypothetical protein